MTRQARYTIRGISSQSGYIGYAPTGATIGVYLDGTPVTAALGPDNQVSGTLFDIERVEVLKGPQGTLFGEGSQGGTIRYLYKKPDATAFDAAANLGFSSMAESDDMSNRIDGMINVPLSDNAAFRLTAWRAETAGFIENLEPFEEDFNTAESTGVRAALRYEGDAFTVTGTVHHSVQETQGGLGTFRAYGDKLDNYEIGLKATLWGGRATVLASAYYLDWKDMLVYVNDPAIAPGGDSHNANSGGAEITGFELELNAFVTDRFSVRLAGDINESEVTEVGVPFQNAEDGNELRYAPGDSMSIALDYALPVGGDWLLDLHLDHAWVAKQFGDSQNRVVVPRYEKTNARATLRSADQKWRVALFVTNLANDEILRGRDLLATLYWHNPRQIGLEVGYQL